MVEAAIHFFAFGVWRLGLSTAKVKAVTRKVTNNHPGTRPTPAAAPAPLERCTRPQEQGGASTHGSSISAPRGGHLIAALSRVVRTRLLAGLSKTVARGLPAARSATIALVAGSVVAGAFAFTAIEASIVTAPPEPDPPAEESLLVIGSEPEPQWPTIEELAYLTEPPEPRDPGPDLSFLDEDRRLTRDEVKVLAEHVGFPEHTLEEVADVAWCESRFDPRATNDGVRGLMQLHVMWFGYAGVSLEKWADPMVNMEVALVVYHYDLGKGYEPWTQWQCRPGGRIAPPRESLVQEPGDEANGEDGTANAAASTPTSTPVAEETPTPVPDESEAAEPVETPAHTDVDTGSPAEPTVTPAADAEGEQSPPEPDTDD